MPRPAARRAACPAFLFIAMLALFGVRPAGAATFDVVIDPLPGEAFIKAHYAIYIPDGVPLLRALIVHQHGCGRGQGDMYTPWDLHWQALADRWDSGLLAAWYEDGGNCGNWAHPKNGSDRALNEAFVRFGKQAGHPELATLPYCLWGHSGGGDWVMAMSAQHPNRTIAVVARSGGRDHGAQIHGIPMLLVHGTNDIGSDMLKVWISGRTSGALWAFAKDLDTWHECADLRVLAIPFFDAALALRLPEKPTGDAEKCGLLPLDPAKGWLGDAGTFATGAASAAKGDANAAHWLANQDLARRWSEFANPQAPHHGGWCADPTPPEYAPWQVSATVSGTTVALSWRARADLESGIKHFVIYRDDQAVGTLGGSAGTNNVGGGFFQWGGFGDEVMPSPPFPNTPAGWPFPVIWNDRGVAAGAHTYRIATVNGDSVEGPKSVPIPLTIGGGGGGGGGDATATPTLVITAPKPGKNAAVTTPQATTTLSGTSAVSGTAKVIQVAWWSSRGASGVASGTDTWTATDISLHYGDNRITVAAYDDANHVTTQELLVVCSKRALPLKPLKPLKPANPPKAGKTASAANAN